MTYRPHICPYCQATLGDDDEVEFGFDIVCTGCMEELAAEAIGKFVQSLWTPEFERIFLAKINMEKTEHA